MRRKGCVVSDSKSGNRILIDDLAGQIGQAMAAANEDAWKNSGGNESIRRAIVAAMNKHGWKLDGVPGVLPSIYWMLEEGQILARSTFNNAPCADIDDVKTSPANWYVSDEDMELIVKRLLGGLGESKTDEERWSIAGFIETTYNDKLIDWRYWVHQMPHLTAGQAAHLMCALDPDVYAVTENHPRLVDAGKRISNALKIERLAVAQNQVEASANEWLEWAESHHIVVHDGFRLATNAATPPPETPVTSTEETGEAKPLQRQRYQEQEILRVVRELGVDPMALPVPIPGTSGIKAKVRKQLTFSKTVFDKAWERLRGQGDIKDAA